MKTTHFVELCVVWRGDVLSVRHVPARAWVAVAEAGWGALGDGAIAVPEGLGQTNELRDGEVALRVTRVLGVGKMGRSRVDGRALAGVLVAAMLHALAFGAFAHRARYEPSASAEIDVMRGFLARSDEASRVDATNVAIEQDQTSRTPSEAMERAPMERGQGGDVAKAPSSPRSTVSDDPTTGDDARTFGMLGLLANGADRAGTPETWATTKSENGALFGTLIGESYGIGGLDLSGIGQGGGGSGAGARIEAIDTHAEHDAFGSGRGTLQLHQHRAGFVCHLGFEIPMVTGTLPPESIQRVVRENAGRFRGCYAAGVARTPTLSGRVSTRFLIGRDGSVSAVDDAGSDLPDAAVVSCVQRTFAELAFPAPAGSTIRVVYPLVFSPE